MGFGTSVGESAKAGWDLDETPGVIAPDLDGLAGQRIARDYQIQIAVIVKISPGSRRAVGAGQTRANIGKGTASITPDLSDVTGLAGGLSPSAEHQIEVAIAVVIPPCHLPIDWRQDGAALNKTAAALPPELCR